MNDGAPPVDVLDTILSIQFVVAWAGEQGEGVTARLGWWQTDLVSQDSGGDFFRRLTPNTWQWATLQGAREAARRQDAARRVRDHNPDRLLTLFHLGPVLDGWLEERLQELKRAGLPPTRALPVLDGFLRDGGDRWVPAEFWTWVAQHASVSSEAAPVGRRLKGAPPADPVALVGHLLSALAPPTPEYPLPHYRRTT